MGTPAFSIYSATKGYLDEIPLTDVIRFEKEFLDYLDNKGQTILASIRDTKDLTADNEKALQEAIEQFRKGFATNV
ncbi:ATP synthase subunit alpha [compost metagenome]